MSWYSKLSVLFGCTFLLVSSGCATNTGRGALAGSAIGSGVGALVGMASGNPRAGAAMGAALGGGLGTAIGADADYREKVRSDEIELANAEAAATQASQPRGELSIDDIVQLSTPDSEGRRVSDEVLIEYIRSTNSVYRLTPADLQYLNANHVSERVQREMLSSASLVHMQPPVRLSSSRPRTMIVQEPPIVIYEHPIVPFYVRPAPMPGIMIHGRFR